MFAEKADLLEHNKRKENQELKALKNNMLIMFNMTFKSPTPGAPGRLSLGGLCFLISGLGVLSPMLSVEVI